MYRPQAALRELLSSKVGVVFTPAAVAALPHACETYLRMFAPRAATTLDIFGFVSLKEHLEEYLKVDSRIRTVYEEYDKNGSGDLDASELAAALNDLVPGARVDARSALDLMRAHVPAAATTLDIWEFAELEKAVAALSRKRVAGVVPTSPAKVGKHH